MGIKVAPKGEAERAVLAGKIVGESQAAQRRIEYTRQVQEQLRSIAAQKEMAEFSHQLTLERAKFHATMDLEGEKRARAWELEKMELRSRVDFEKEERKRIKEEEEYELGVRMILENDNLTPERKEDALAQFQMRKLAGDVPSAMVRREPEVDPIKAYIRQRLGAEGAQTMQLGQPITDERIREAAGRSVAAVTGGRVATPQNRIRVVSPDGRTGTIFANEWPQYEAAGYRRI